MPIGPHLKHQDAVDAVAYSPDGSLILTESKDGTARLWDAATGHPFGLTPQNVVGDLSFSVGFSPDGRWLVSSTRSRKESYHFWHVGSWELGQCIDQERNGIAFHSPAFTRDGRLMAMGIAPDQILLADAATGRGLARRPRRPIPACPPRAGRRAARSGRRRSPPCSRRPTGLGRCSLPPDGGLELSTLAIGKASLEIEADDLVGAPFRLTQHRGKVPGQAGAGKVLLVALAGA
jgi:hypothetical protein